MAGSRRQWGWYELRREWADRVVDAAGVRAGDLVLDIGAGAGALTLPLLERGARVIAVESHPGRANLLRCRFGDDVMVVQADAADLRTPRRPFVVVANPPFAVASPLLRRLVAPGSRLEAATVVLPEAVVRRWTGPDAPGRRRWARWYTATAGVGVPRSAFAPAPQVSCRLLSLRRLRR